MDGKYERLPQCNPNPLRKPTVKIDIFWQLLVAMVLVGTIADFKPLARLLLMCGRRLRNIVAYMLLIEAHKSTLRVTSSRS